MTTPEHTAVTSALRRLRTKAAGEACEVEYHAQDSSWTVDFRGRQRLDHYVGEFYNPGEDDDPEGWDQEGWDEEYVQPLLKEVEAYLVDRFGRDVFDLDVGEKGHLYVSLKK